MKILIINALKSGGGAEIQSQRERKLLESKDHSVHILTFDSSQIEAKGKTESNIPYTVNTLIRIFYRNHILKKHYLKVKKIINTYNPDVIHINNLQDNGYSVLEACKGYPVIKTIRDPGIICPITTCLKSDLNICDGFMFMKCHKCIGKRINYQIYALQAQSIRAKYLNTISQFICPSEFLSKSCISNGIPTLCVNNPFDFSIIKKENVTFNKSFLYYGYISKSKGVKNLMTAFSIFHRKHRDTSLIIAGKLGDITKKEIDSFKCNGIKYIGELPQTEIMELYKQIYCVVVPSIWLENYPNTVLEALACKTLVIGSNRGGITELIQKKDLMFNPLLIEDIVDKLDYSYRLNEEDYVKIVTNNFLRIKRNNSLELYYCNLMEIIENVISKSNNHSI